MTKEGRFADVDKKVLDAWKQYHRLMKPVDVVIPFAPDKYRERKEDVLRLYGAVSYGLPAEHMELVKNILLSGQYILTDYDSHQLSTVRAIEARLRRPVASSPAPS